MTSNELSRPKFKDETEEAEWWYDHREALAEIDVQTIRKGEAKRRTLDSMIAEAAGRRIARDLGLSDTDFEQVARVADALNVSATECLRRLVLARVQAYSGGSSQSTAQEAA